MPTCPKVCIDGTPCGQPLGHIGRHGNGMFHAGRGWGDGECKPDKVRGEIMPSESVMPEKVKRIAEGYEILLNYSRMIAMLPINEWIQGLSHAETVGPILDPTLYRQYIYSRKPEILKKILYAALELKRVMEEIQPEAMRLIAEEEAERAKRATSPR